MSLFGGFNARLLAVQPASDGTRCSHTKQDSAMSRPSTCLVVDVSCFRDNAYRYADMQDTPMPCIMATEHCTWNKKKDAMMAGILEKLFRHSHDVGDICSCAMKPLTEIKYPHTQEPSTTTMQYRLCRQCPRLCFSACQRSVYTKLSSKNGMLSTLL